MMIILILRNANHVIILAMNALVQQLHVQVVIMLIIVHLMGLQVAHVMRGILIVDLPCVLSVLINVLNVILLQLTVPVAGVPIVTLPPDAPALIDCMTIPYQLIASLASILA